MNFGHSVHLSDALGRDLAGSPRFLPPARSRPSATSFGRWRMRDLVDDWRKWSAGERLLAVVLALLPIGLPIAVWLRFLA